MTDDDLVEQLVASHLIHQGSYLTIRLDTVSDATGAHHPREWVEHPGAVAILALVDDELLLVRQYRHAVRQICLEVPAGTLDRGADGSREDPDLAAPRELAEETGYRAQTWRKLGTFFTAPGFASEEMHLYLATDLTPIDGYAGPEEDERLDLVRLPRSEALAMVDAGEIHDAKTLVALMWLKRLDRETPAAP